MTDFICPRCQSSISGEEFLRKLQVCDHCGYHSRLSWQDRLRITADEGSFTEFDSAMGSENPIGFPLYKENIRELQKKTGTGEAVVSGACAIMGYPAVICIMDSRFMMASMGSVVGEKITRAFEYGTEHKLPVIIFTASGGARMQEGVFSLMQMAKTSGAAARHSRAGQLYITVMADPTTGGVTASFASLGDIIIAEPGVLIGFAGKRVIQDTIGYTLPEKFQSAEFVFDHGFADMIVRRDEMHGVLSRLLRGHGYRRQAGAADSCGAPDSGAAAEASGAKDGAEQGAAEQNAAGPKLTVVQRLELLHSLGRPSVHDFIPRIFDDFIELHGDRYFGDDPAILGGIGSLGGRAVTLIAQVRGRDIEELKRVNFSMPHPEGYRKAVRLAKQAERFHRPVICFIDTPGAYCGVGAEERGQGEAIARSLQEFMMLKTPVISVILGEGGSGGALALGVCDELAMLENSLYSVISPKGFASILWKDGKREKEAAELMKITAEDLLSFGLCERIIGEGGGAGDVEITAKNISAYLLDAVKRLSAEENETLPEKRYRKFRSMGIFSE
ncbi:hypothetical protein AGMMS49546_38250 [Spirochaetia bacterium]|nr:hypothetical protein AGMMS49546_38250 [Spirochaetia bacterium]